MVPLSGPKREEDNYELSEREDSEDEAAEERAQARRATKRIPDWARTSIATLETQGNVDPDSIFGEHVPGCDLDLIFTDALYRACGAVQPKRRRGSSGQWHADCLSSSDVTRYRQKMGHKRRYSSLKLRPSIVKALKVINKGGVPQGRAEKAVVAGVVAAGVAAANAAAVGKSRRT